MRKQLTLFEIWQNDRSRAIKLNERTPRYLMFYRRSSPSDVNSPSYLRINCWRLHVFFQNSVRTQGAAVCRRSKMARCAFDLLKAFYQGENGSSVSGIQSWHAKQN